MGFLIINLGVGYLTTSFIPGWFMGFMTLLVSCLATAILLGLIRLAEFLSILTE